MYANELFMNGSDCDLSGVKIAKCISNADPKAQERVWVRVYGVHDMQSTDPEYGIWASHCAPSKYTSGEFPDVDDHIYVMFPDIKDPNQCIYLGYCRHS